MELIKQVWGGEEKKLIFILHFLGKLYFRVTK